MKQRLRKLLSGFLCIALIASAVVGALSASVLPAKADEFPASGYLDDLFVAAFEDVPSENRVTLEYYQSLFDERFDDYLIVVIHDTVLNGWYFAAYDGTNGTDPVRWCLNNSSYTPYYTTLLAKYSNNGYYDTSCNFIAGCKFQGSSWSSHGGNAMGNTSLSQLVNWNTGWQYLTPNPLYLNMSGYECYSNRDLYKWNNDDPSDSRFMVANLNPGSDVPPVIEYHWFKFNLGDRWYITTYDQSLMSMLQQGDSTFWVWSMYASRLSDPDHAESIFIWWPDVQYLSYAENFISQNLTNVSSSGVLAYDITDLILDPDYIFLGIADFYQVLDTTSGYVLGNLMAESSDQVELTLTPSEENNSNDQAWTVINNYFTSYPSVTVAPKELASQFAGQSAYTGGIGTVQIPQQLQEYKTGSTLPDLDSEFHYDLSASGLQPSEMSYLNFDLLNVVIVPARNSDLVDAAAFNLRYWDYNIPVVNGCIDSYQIGHFHYSNDLFESFDLILIVDADSWWLQDTSTPYTIGPYTHLMYGYTGDISPDEGLVEEFGLFPCYWVLTRSAIQKSQLYVFCDGFDKLYDLASQYCNKRDLWDSSFFDWSMSIFWELQSLDGHLNSIDFTIKSWDLGNKLSSIVSKLQEISDNTSETDVDPWYLALFNWIKAFEPSNIDFIGWVEEYDDFVDDLPDPGGATIIPFPTAAPTALPTVAVAGG